MDITLIIDGNSYVHAFWAGTQGQAQASVALRSLAEHFIARRGANVVVAFDHDGPSWRHAIYPDYKAHRKAKEPSLIAQLDSARRTIEACGWLLPGIDNHEADDVMAMHAHERLQLGRRVVICTRDKDFHQLLADGQLTILKRASTNRGGWEYEFFTAKNLWATTSLRPDQWAGYRALVGDPSDNWPGCASIGEKSAHALIRQTGSLAAVMETVARDPFSLPLKPRQREKLAHFDWQLGLRLMTLRRDLSTPLPLEFDHASASACASA